MSESGINKERKHVLSNQIYVTFYVPGYYRYMNYNEMTIDNG